MKREFISTSWFDRAWEDIGLTDEDRRRLENALQDNPKIGDLMEGTGGLRKMRFAFEHQGKSGSTKVCYVDMVIKEKIVFVDVFVKKDKENLTKAERNELKKIVKLIIKEV